MSKGEVEIISRGVMIADGKLLVCHTKGASNTYLPGGHVDFGEDSKAALVREISEEMDLDASVGRFIGVCEHAFVQQEQEHCEVNLLFEMEVAELNPEQAPKSAEDYIEFQWLEMSGLEGSDLEPEALRARLQKWFLEDVGPERWTSNISR